MPANFVLPMLLLFFLWFWWIEVAIQLFQQRHGFCVLHGELQFNKPTRRRSNKHNFFVALECLELSNIYHLDGGVLVAHMIHIDDWTESPFKTRWNEERNAKQNSSVCKHGLPCCHLFLWNWATYEIPLKTDISNRSPHRKFFGSSCSTCCFCWGSISFDHVAIFTDIIECYCNFMWFIFHPAQMCT